MTHPMSPRDIFLSLVHAVGERQVADLPRMYAETTNVTHPFDPFGAPPLLTRDELRAHFAGGAESDERVCFHPTHITIHDTLDPEVIVAEFTYQSDTTAPGETFAIPCIFVLRVRNGEIVESRDYIDPVRSAQAHGRLDALSDVIEQLTGSH
jgi:ketosteroid isomerase-like protein